jgi:hypothetical protein
MMRGTKTWMYGARLQKQRDLRGNRCEVCGGDGRIPRGRRRRLTPLEFAHVKETGLSGRGRGMRLRVLDVERHPDCYKLMCWPCHKRFDFTQGPAPRERNADGELNHVRAA